MNIVRAATIVACLELAMGCASLGEVKTKATSPYAVVGGAGTTCELRQKITYSAGGAVQLHAWDPGDDGEGTCLKWAGKPVAAGGPVFIRSKNLDMFHSGNWTGLCRPGTAGFVADTTWQACEWNRSYRDKYLFDFKLEASGGDLREYVSVVRLYLNGEMVASWDSESGGKYFSVDARVIKRQLLPYDAALDLHIIPAGISIDAGVIDKELKKRRRWDLTVLAATLDVVQSVNIAGDAGAGQTLGDAMKCFRWVVDELRARAEAVAGGQYTATLAPNGTCISFAGLPGPTNPTTALVGDGSLTESAFAAQKSIATKAVDDEMAGLSATLGQAVQKLGNAHKSWLDTVRALLVAARAADNKPLVRDISEAIEASEKRVSDMVVFASAAQAGFDETRLVIFRAIDAAEAIGKSPEKQSVLFSELVRKLDEAGGPFEARNPNPAPYSEEVAVLDMVYRDHFQGFMISPWWAAPISFHLEDVQINLSAATIVPALDLFGVRWQWGDSRFSQLRLGAGIMFYEDTILIASVEKNQTVFAFEANANLGGFSLGVAVPPNQGAYPEFKDSLRLLVGADLVRLITGSSFEAL